jgi:hypothetical protein
VADPLLKCGTLGETARLQSSNSLEQALKFRVSWPSEQNATLLTSRTYYKDKSRKLNIQYF